MGENGFNSFTLINCLVFTIWHSVNDLIQYITLKIKQQEIYYRLSYYDKGFFLYSPYILL